MKPDNYSDWVIKIKDANQEYEVRVSAKGSSYFRASEEKQSLVSNDLSKFQPRRTRNAKMWAFVFSIVTTLIQGVRGERLLFESAPGTRLLGIVEFLCSTKSVEKVFIPLVADWHKEYFDALTEKRWFKARWISVRYTWSFILAMGLNRLLSFIKSFTSAK